MRRIALAILALFVSSLAVRAGVPHCDPIVLSLQGPAHSHNHHAGESHSAKIDDDNHDGDHHAADHDNSRAPDEQCEIGEDVDHADISLAAAEFQDAEKATSFSPGDPAAQHISLTWPPAYRPPTLHPPPDWATIALRNSIERSDRLLI
jgi:hypothetical protein